MCQTEQIPRKWLLWRSVQTKYRILEEKAQVQLIFQTLAFFFTVMATNTRRLLTDKSTVQYLLFAW